MLGDSTCFPSWVGSAVCDWGLYVGFWLSGCCASCGWVGVWSGGVALTGFFRWFLGCSEGSGLVKGIESYIGGVGI